MIETLTFAIAASPSYKMIRQMLFGSIPTEYVKSRDELFRTLYNSWCFNPISTLTLCLLS